jgi:hypothetical protein
MECFASLFVGKPLNILIVAAIFLLMYLIVRFVVHSASLHSNPFLVIAITWGVYALWEWLVITQTPEANIRVDLLVIWPILAVLTVWQTIRIFR